MSVVEESVEEDTKLLHMQTLTSILPLVQAEAEELVVRQAM